MQILRDKARYVRKAIYIYIILKESKEWDEMGRNLHDWIIAQKMNISMSKVTADRIIRILRQSREK